MAIYHLSAQIIGRSDGRSSLACAAYRSGEVLIDERTGTRHQHGDPERVAHTEIIAPAGSPAWAVDRSTLWNRLEQHERRKDAQLAREWEIALPVELTLVQQRDLVRGWVADQLAPAGMIADVAIHHTKAGKPANPHVHIMAPLRPFDPAAETWGGKFRDPDRHATLAAWRSSWADHANAALERAGHEARIDHRSHADRGIEEEPTKKEGMAARGMEARDQASDRMANNRAIRARNQKRREALAKLKAEAKANRPSKERVAERRIATGAKGARDRPAGAGATRQAAATLASRNARRVPEQVKPAPGPQPTTPVSPGINDDVLLAAMRDRLDKGR